MEKKNEEMVEQLKGVTQEKAIVLKENEEIKEKKNILDGNLEELNEQNS